MQIFCLPKLVELQIKIALSPLQKKLKCFFMKLTVGFLNATCVYFKTNYKISQIKYLS